MNWPLHFVWPHWLWALSVWPLLLLLYVWVLRRRKRHTLAYGQLGLVREALGRSAGWRRHVPPFVLWLAVGLSLLAAARPVAKLTLPSHQQTVILAMDVSGSMRAADVEPNRLVASQNAAKAFLADLPRQVKVGIVAFAGTAQVVQPVTHNREDLVAAIDKFHLQRATAIGSAIVVALTEIFPDQRQLLSPLLVGRNSDPFAPQGRAIEQALPQGEVKPVVPVAPGSYGSAAIILLTDGQRTTGVDTAEAAQLAADRGVRVYTVGVGTVDGEVIGFEGWSMRVRLDEDSLKQVARHTQGEYFYAGTADSLKQVYQSLGSRLTVEKKDTEIAGLLALLSGVLMLLAGGLSLAWYGRVL
jgi:Ca-activated chloride channel family protein